VRMKSRDLRLAGSYRHVHTKIPPKRGAHWLGLATRSNVKP
jgi:hypothetical protein